MRNVESKRPFDPFTHSPSRRILETLDIYSKANREERQRMHDSARVANQAVADSIVDVMSGSHSPTQAINLGFWYATGTLDRLVLHSAESVIPAEHSVATHLSDSLADVIAPALGNKNDLHPLAEWLTRIPATAAGNQLNSLRLGMGLHNLANEMKMYNGLVDVKMSPPAWKLGRFITPQK